MYSVSRKILVSFGSNPIAMMSRMLSYPTFVASSRLSKSLKRNFSSSVI